MKILGIIPARKGSKRVPGKNTKLLNGIPLVEYVFRACSKCSLFDKIVISSDDGLVEEIAKKYHRLVFLRRPEQLASDDSLAIEYVKHTLTSLNEIYDYVAIVQPTTPFVTAEDIENTVRLLLNSKEADSAVTVSKVQQLCHPYKIKTMEGSLLKSFMFDEKDSIPAQGLPLLFVRNGAVYISRAAVIMQGRVIGDVCLGYEMPFERSVDINDTIDFEFADFLAKKFFSTRS